MLQFIPGTLSELHKDTYVTPYQCVRQPVLEFTGFPSIPFLHFPIFLTHVECSPQYDHGSRRMSERSINYSVASVQLCLSFRILLKNARFILNTIRYVPSSNSKVYCYLNLVIESYLMDFRCRIWLLLLLQNQSPPKRTGCPECVWDKFRTVQFCYYTLKAIDKFVWLDVGLKQYMTLVYPYCSSELNFDNIFL